MRHRRISYDSNAMRQSACLVINPITVDNFATLFNGTPMDQASDSMILVSWDRSFHLLLGHRGSTDIFRFPVVLFVDRPGISICHATRCICRAHVFASS